MTNDKAEPIKPTGRRYRFESLASIGAPSKLRNRPIPLHFDGVRRC